MNLVFHPDCPDNQPYLFIGTIKDPVVIEKILHPNEDMYLFDVCATDVSLLGKTEGTQVTVRAGCGSVQTLLNQAYFKLRSMYKGRVYKKYKN